MKRIQNRKIYYLAMLSLVGGLSFAGYNKNQLSHFDKKTYLAIIDPKMNDKINTITYDALADLHVVFLSKTNDAFITIKNSGKYYDYFSGMEIKDYDFLKNQAITVDYDIDIFLMKYDYYKDEYSDEDLINLLNMIKNDYMVERDKSSGYELVLKKGGKVI